MDLPNVFDHADFRRYLDEWFRARKVANPRFSHRAFARRVGSNDPSVLVNVIAGRRRLADDRVESFVTTLGLDGDAAEYFRLLVAFGQADQRADRERAWASIALLRSRLREPEIDSSRFLYLSNRIYTAIQALAQCVGFRDDPAWVARQLRPPVSEAEAADALGLLERLGFLERRGDTLFPAEPLVRTSETVATLGSFGYQVQNHTLAGEVLERLWDPEGPYAETAFLGLTLAVPDSRIQDLRRLLWEAQLNIMHQCEAWGPAHDRVVQVNIQMFPVSETTKATD